MGTKIKFSIYYKAKNSSEVKVKDVYEESQDKAILEFRKEFPEDYYDIQTII